MLIVNGGQSIFIALSEIIPYFLFIFQNSTDLNIFDLKEAILLKICEHSG
jgi:hypothetical protein